MDTDGNPTPEEFLEYGKGGPNDFYVEDINTEYNTWEGAPRYTKFLNWTIIQSRWGFWQVYSKELFTLVDYPGRLTISNVEHIKSDISGLTQIGYGDASTGINWEEQGSSVFTNPYGAVCHCEGKFSKTVFKITYSTYEYNEMSFTPSAVKKW
jgi:hypothetical protein